MAAVEFDQNLTFKGDEQDFIRQVHSELYQLETETYGLGCPGCGVNSNCCTCKYWTREHVMIRVVDHMIVVFGPISHVVSDTQEQR